MPRAKKTKKRPPYVVALQMDEEDLAKYDELAANPPAGVKVTPSYVLRRALTLAIERLREIEA